MTGRATDGAPEFVVAVHAGLGQPHVEVLDLGAILELGGVGEFLRSFLGYLIVSLKPGPGVAKPIPQVADVFLGDPGS